MDGCHRGEGSGCPGPRPSAITVTANLARASNQLATTAERIDTLFAAARDVATIISPAM